MSNTRLTLVGALVVCVCSMPVTAADIVVDRNHADANDVNPGTADKPLATIRAADRLVGPGDTILVEAGVYRETVMLTKRS